MSAPWPDDLCSRCPYGDMCDLNDPADMDGGCRRVEDWREDAERKADEVRESALMHSLRDHRPDLAVKLERMY